jgi:hypothetical protein
MASMSEAALSWSSSGLCGVTSWPSRNAISDSMPGVWNTRSSKFAGLWRTPAGGSGACVSVTLREPPPDFQWPGRAPSSPNQSSAAATASCRLSRWLP